MVIGAMFTSCQKEEFEIEIPDDEVAEMPTVKSMLNYLTSQGIS